jgi:hypothetical protein
VANTLTESVRLAFDFPKSVTLLSGEEKWEGTLAEGEEHVIKIMVRTLSNDPIKIVGKATIGDGAIVQQQMLILNAQKEKPAPPPDPPVKRKRGQDQILEFKGE